MNAGEITSIEIRGCRGPDDAAAIDPLVATKLPGGTRPDFTVVTVTTADGTQGSSFGFGALDARAAAAALTQVRPFFLGRDVFHSAQNLKEFEMFDRKWNLTPMYAYGPFDNACWDVVGKQLDQPTYRVLGAARQEIPVYVSSMFLDSPADYADQAVRVQDEGFKGYKLHPPGEPGVDLECYRAVRAAVGPDFALMADPVISYRYEDALRIGRELEQLGYLWLEEPLLDANAYGLKKLREKLDIPLCATEVLPGGIPQTAHYISERIVDIVRTDVSWRGGISSAVRTAHLAEAFGVSCELHTTIYHALEQVQIHAALAISNTTFFELLYPFDDFVFGTHSSLHIVDGMVQAPTGPGLGIIYDWDFIDDHTVVRA